MSAGEISHRLHRIYRHCVERLLIANPADDVACVEEVIRLLTPLRDAWDEAERRSIKHRPWR